MGTPEQTAVDPVTALSGAARLTAAGDRMLTRWRGHRARIEALDARAPWGDDAAGRQFNQNYLAGGDQAPAANVLDVGESLVVAVAGLGPQVIDGVRGTEDIDQLTGRWLRT
jgi:hypothetical protein